MSKKRRNRHKKEGQEPRFDFDEAKELTVGQAIRKNEEVEAGVLPEDSILDKYVKQHKDEIEADKFATRQYKKEKLVETQSLDDLIQEIREETEVESSVQEDDLNQFDDLEFTHDSEVPPVEEFETEEVQLFEGEEVPILSRVTDSEDGESKKKWVIYGILAALAVLILGTGYYVYRQVTRSTQEIQTAQSTSSEQNVFKCLWIIDFPLFEWSDEEQRLMATHHPFTMPNPDDIPLLDEHPEQVRAKAYDFVCNGIEVGGGSLRIHDTQLQEKMFEVLGFTPERAEAQFGFLMNAFKYGAPPHAGLAFGLDRFVSILAGLDSIRDCIAFPKNNSGRDVMLDAPSAVDQKQLDELEIKLDIKD